MIRVAIAALSDRTNHPALVGLLLVAALLLLAGVAVSAVYRDGLLSGFLAVYAVLAGTLGLAGLALAALARLGARLVRRYDAV